MNIRQTLSIVACFFIMLTACNSTETENQTQITDEDKIEKTEESHIVAAVLKGDKWIYIDEHDQQLYDKDFTYASEFVNDLACVATDGQRMLNSVMGANYHAMKSNGDIIKKIVSDQPFMFGENRAFTYQENKTFLVDNKGKVIKSIDGIASTIPYTEGVGVVYLNNKLELWDKDGKVIKDISDYTVYAPNEGFILAQRNSDDMFGYLDLKGNVALDFVYKDAFHFKDGITNVMDSEGKWHVINKKGEILFSNFTKMTSSKNGKLAIFRDNEWMYVNKKGEQIFEETFLYASKFTEGIAVVKLKDGTLALLDENGKTIPTDAVNILEFKNGLAIAEKNGKMGFLNKEGEWAIAPQYVKVNYFNKYIK